MLLLSFTLTSPSLYGSRLYEYLLSPSMYQILDMLLVLTSSSLQTKPTCASQYSLNICLPKILGLKS